MSLNQQIFDDQLDHAANLRLYEAGVHKQIDKIMSRHGKRMTKLLSDNTYESRKAMRALEMKIRREIHTTVSDAKRYLTSEMKKVVVGESEAVADTLHAAVGKHYRVRTPSKVELRNLVAEMPIIGDQTLEKSLEHLGVREYTKVRSVIRTGLAQASSTVSIAKDVQRITGATKAQARAITRTSITSFATRAAMDTYRENEDIITGFEYVATLDTRTTPVCARNDGRVFKIDNPKAPRPPLHWNCRSTTVPVTTDVKDWPDNDRVVNKKGMTPGFRASAGGQVSASMDYDGWLRTQARAVQLRHFQFDEIRHRKWLTGNIPLRQFTNPKGDWISHAQLRKFDLARAYPTNPNVSPGPIQKTPVQEPEARAKERGQRPVFERPVLSGPGSTSVSLAEMDLDALLTDKTLQATLIGFFKAQKNSKESTFYLVDTAGESTKGRRANLDQINRDTYDSNPDAYRWNHASGERQHTKQLDASGPARTKTTERIRLNRVRKPGANKPRDTYTQSEKEWIEYAYDVEGSAGLTRAQQDFLIDVFLPQIDNNIVSYNQATVALRAVANMFQSQNKLRGPAKTDASRDTNVPQSNRDTNESTRIKNPEAFLVSQLAPKEGGAMTEIGKLIGAEGKRARRLNESLNRMGIHNRISGDLEAYEDLYKRRKEIAKEHNEWEYEETWITPAITNASRDTNVPQSKSKSKLKEIDEVSRAFKKTLEYSARTGVLDRDKLSIHLGKQLGTSVSLTSSERLTLGRDWFIRLDKDLKKNGWKDVYTESRGRQVLKPDTPTTMGGSGDVRPVTRTHTFQISDQSVLDQLTRGVQLNNIKKLGVLERGQIPEIRPDGRYLDGTKVDTLRTRGHFNDVDPRVVNNLKKRDRNPHYVDDDMAGGFLKMLDTQGPSRFRTLVSDRRDFEPIAVLRFYKQNKYTVERKGKKKAQTNNPVFFTHKNHEYDRTMAMGALTPTSGEVWRPFLDGPRRTFGEKGYREFQRYTGALIDKKSDSHQSWQDVFDENREGLYKIGRIFSAYAQTKPGGQIKSLKDLNIKTVDDAFQAIERNKLLNSIELEKLPALIRAALEVYRIGQATNGKFDKPASNKRLSTSLLKYESTIRIELDASSQGAGIQSTLFRNQTNMGKTGLTPGPSKQRIYNVIAEAAEEEIRAKTDLQIDMDALAKLQKNNLMTALYGSGGAQRTQRISESLVGIINDSPELVTHLTNNSRMFAVGWRELATAQRGIDKAISRIERSAKTSVSDAVDQSQSIIELKRLKENLRDMVRRGLTDEDDLTDWDLIDDPDTSKLIEDLFTSDLQLITSDELATVAKVLTKEFEKAFPGYRTYFDVQSKAALKYIELANEHSPTPVTTIPVRDFTGKVVDLDFTRYTKTTNRYLDRDGTLVENTYKVHVEGQYDTGEIKRGYGVKFVFAQDAAISRKLTDEFDSVSSVYDSVFVGPDQISAIRDRARDLMVDMYRADVLEENLNELRSRLPDAAHDDWDEAVIDFLAEFDIDDVDEEFIDLMLDDDLGKDWYGWTY